ncbi:MAG: FkbM family methyltransferase, partial [Holosporaceae bacterium]|nr:FkbM family methyltransferase [Holosporaceae bacterium]
SKDIPNKNPTTEPPSADVAKKESTGDLAPKDCAPPISAMEGPLEKLGKKADKIIAKGFRKITGKKKKRSAAEQFGKDKKGRKECSSAADGPIVAAPLYTKLVPVRGWDRYSGDSAGTASQWLRWWRYLRLGKPVLMSWVNGMTLKIFPKNEVGRALFVSGIYDPNNLVIVDALLKKDDVFIDVGANMGYFSLLISQTLNENGHIYALEPSKRDFDRLAENIELNDLGDTISHYRYAVTDAKGSAELQIATEERNALNTLGSDFSVSGLEKICTETVPTISLDEFVAEEGISKVNVIKLDVEGSELKALMGARKTIQKHKPTIMLGLNVAALKACGADIQKIESLLQELDYSMYKAVEDQGFALKKVVNIVDANSAVIFCLHKNVNPPPLPQPEKVGVLARIANFFK